VKEEDKRPEYQNKSSSPFTGSIAKERKCDAPLGVGSQCDATHGIFRVRL
jgi:hypothetical protein